METWKTMIWDLISRYGFEVTVNDMGLLYYLVSKGWDKIEIGRVLSPLFLNSHGMAWLKNKNITRVGIEPSPRFDSAGIRISLYADTSFMAMASHCPTGNTCGTCLKTGKKIAGPDGQPLVKFQKALLERKKWKGTPGTVLPVIDRLVLYGECR
jgi:hypothetical protein